MSASTSITSGTSRKNRYTHTHTHTHTHTRSEMCRPFLSIRDLQDVDQLCARKLSKHTHTHTQRLTFLLFFLQRDSTCSDARAREQPNDARAARRANVKLIDGALKQLCAGTWSERSASSDAARFFSSSRSAFSCRSWAAAPIRRRRARARPRRPRHLLALEVLLRHGGELLLIDEPVLPDQARVSWPRRRRPRRTRSSRSMNKLRDSPSPDAAQK